MELMPAGVGAGAVYSGREHYDSLIISTPPFLSSRPAVAVSAAVHRLGRRVARGMVRKI